MKTIIIILLFIGMFFVVNGVYEQKLKAIEANSKTEYKFIPRTYYEEQLAGQDINNKLTSMFDHASPWFDQNVGAGLDVNRTDRQT